MFNGLAPCSGAVVLFLTELELSNSTDETDQFAAISKNCRVPLKDPTIPLPDGFVSSLPKVCGIGNVV